MKHSTINPLKARKRGQATDKAMPEKSRENYRGLKKGKFKTFASSGRSSDRTAGNVTNSGGHGMKGKKRLEESKQ